MLISFVSYMQNKLKVYYSDCYLGNLRNFEILISMPVPILNLFLITFNLIYSMILKSRFRVNGKEASSLKRFIFSQVNL